MIIKMDYEDIGLVGIRTNYNGKIKSHYIRYIVDEYSIEKAKEYGLQVASVAVRGPGVGRESALRALQNSGVVVISIVDNTYYPHNGCRPPKRRRR